MASSLLLVTLTVFFLSLETFVLTSHTLNNHGPFQIMQRKSRNNIVNSSFSQVISHSVSSGDILEGSGQNVDSAALQKHVDRTAILKNPEGGSDGKTSGSGSVSTTLPALTPYQEEIPDQGPDRTNTSVTVYSHSSVHVISEEGLTHTTPEDQLEENRMSGVKPVFLDGLESPKSHVFKFMTNQNRPRPGDPCVLGLNPCVLPNFNGTSLLWDDMRRTLAFAWELHVFGSAGLFILMAVLAVIGITGVFALPHPICDALTLANSLLILSGTLRGVLFFLDPYGTRQILSHAMLAALHNAPLQLLLWAQISLALVTLRGLNLFILSLKLQQPWVVGVMSISHCTPLLLADLFSPPLPPTLPLLLETLSLCCGLPFCLGILTKSFSHVHPFLRSPVPQWVPSQRIEKCAKRVTAVCALLGVLCCSLHMFSLLWLYGLLGNWRRFGWGWWLSQFWARILELAWGFSLLVLGSRIFWIPSRGHLRGNHWQRRSKMFKGVISLWGSILGRIQKGPLKKTEQTWDDLMPNNWAKYKLSRTGFSHNVMCPYDDPPSTTVLEYTSDPVGNISSQSQAALLCQKVGERECIFSLVELDMWPPSPINLRRSIDNALHEQLIAGGLFTPQPLCWTYPVARDTTDRECGTIALPPVYDGYQWKMDPESIQFPSTATEYNSDKWSPAVTYQRETFNPGLSPVIHQHDWPHDDVTNL